MVLRTARRAFSFDPAGQLTHLDCRHTAKSLASRSTGTTLISVTTSSPKRAGSRAPSFNFVGRALNRNGDTRATHVANRAVPAANGSLRRETQFIAEAWFALGPRRPRGVVSHC